MQVRKTPVRICNGGKRKYSSLKSILKSLRFSSLAYSVDPLSVGLDQFICTATGYIESEIFTEVKQHAVYIRTCLKKFSVCSC